MTPVILCFQQVKFIRLFSKIWYAPPYLFSQIVNLPTGIFCRNNEANIFYYFHQKKRMVIRKESPPCWFFVIHSCRWINFSDAAADNSDRPNDRCHVTSADQAWKSHCLELFCQRFSHRYFYNLHCERGIIYRPLCFTQPRACQ